MTSTASGRPENPLHAALELALSAAVLIAADLSVRLVPFGAIARRIQRTLPSSVSPAAPDLAIRRVQWSVRAAHRRLAWIPCLATAIAANRLLAWRGVSSQIWLGVRPGDSAPIAAHAWLEAEGCVVTGGTEKTKFQPLHALMTRKATVS